MSIPVSAPARFVPLSAISYGAVDGAARPVTAAEPLPVTASFTLEERLLREGEPFTTYASNAAGTAVAAGAQNVSIAQATNPPMIGRTFYAESARFVLDQPASAQFAIYPDASSRFSGLIEQHIVAANQMVSVPLRQFLRPSEFQSGAAVLAVRNNLTAGSVTYRGSVSVVGRLLTDDLNFQAAHAILVAGDSISAGSGASRTAAMYHFVVRDALNVAGFDCRLILKANSGSTSSEHETWRAAGWHRPIGRMRMGWYAVGTNDAVQTVAAATYVANIAAYWTWWRALYPTAPLVVLGIPPLVNATHEANAAMLRAAASAYVASVGSPLLRFVDLGIAWSAPDTTKTTDGVHPNDSGHAALATVLNAALQTEGIWPA